MQDKFAINFLFFSNSLRNFDPFEEQKQKSVEDSHLAIEALTENLVTVCDTLSSLTEDHRKQHILKFFEVTLL